MERLSGESTLPKCLILLGEDIGEGGEGYPPRALISLAKVGEDIYPRTPRRTFAAGDKVRHADMKRKYKLQKHLAGKRGVEWLFTFETWCDWWLTNDRWERRGCRPGNLVMARFLDQGPYHPNNVYAATTEQNGRDAYRFQKGKMRMARTKLILGDREADAPASPPWQRSHGQYLTGQSEVTETDLVAAAMEKKWGVGRLRLLVGVELREKFDRQRYLLNRALWHGQLEDVIREAKRMRAAWSALDKAAEASGAASASPSVIWEAALDDGSVAAIVRDERDAQYVFAQGRAVAVYTLAEIGRLLSAFPEIARTKETFPGASVTAAREIRDPLDSIHDTSPLLEEELPF